MKEIVWKVYDKISDLPEGLWEEKIAEADIARHKALLEVIESTLPHRKYLYMMALCQENPVGLVFLTFYNEDNSRDLPYRMKVIVNNIRKAVPGFMLSKIAMTGALETMGRHWWYDSSFWSWEEFVLQILQELKEYNSLYDIIIFRDFILKEENDVINKDISELFKRLNFTEVNELPAARIVIPQNLTNEEEFLMLLKNKGRYTVRKALKNVDAYGLQMFETGNFLEYIDELYSLYLETNKRAEEFITEPLSKEFFISLAKKPELNTHIMGVKNSMGRLISCVVSFENDRTLYPCFLGMDYEVNRELYLIYITFWMMIKRAIEKGHECIELGVTNYFVKGRLGASLLPMKMFIRFKNPLINFLLKGYLYKKLNKEIMPLLHSDEH